MLYALCLFIVPTQCLLHSASIVKLDCLLTPTVSLPYGHVLFILNQTNIIKNDTFTNVHVNGKVFTSSALIVFFSCIY